MTMHPNVRATTPIAFLVLALALVACGGGTATVQPTELPTPTPGAVVELTAEQGQALLAAPPAGLVILDVRTPEEFAQGHLPGAVNIDIYRPDFAERIDELPRDVPYLVYCRSGNRSEAAVRLMVDLWFERIYELSDGIIGWQAAGAPLER